MLYAENHDYEVLFEMRKVYEIQLDREAGKHHQIRVVAQSKSVLSNELKE